MKRTFSDGTQAIQFTPQELLTRLCAPIPPARVHRTRYHAIFAPPARRRAALTGRTSTPRTPRLVDPSASSGPAQAPPSPSPPAPGDPPPAPDRRARLPWADLLRRVH